MAYKKIIVPLDGSKLAEVALPHVEEIAAGCHVSEVALVSVTESLRVQVPRSEVSETVGVQTYERRGGVAGYAGMIYEGESAPMMKVPATVGRMAKAAKDYLVKVAGRLEKKGLAPTVTVLVGNVAEELVKFADEEKADLIVMASHGRSGISHWAIGSVAEKVFRATDVPVLLVKPKAGFKETKPRRKGKPV
jgi:nucleotide-binding universal stress UspA family protein